jgi:hypothetical protein
MRSLGMGRPIFGVLALTLMADQPRFAALDVSLEKTTICVMSLDGTICRGAIVTSDPDAIATWLAADQQKLEQIEPETTWSTNEAAQLMAIKAAYAAQRDALVQRDSEKMN